MFSTLSLPLFVIIHTQNGCYVYTDGKSTSQVKITRKRQQLIHR